MGTTFRRYEPDQSFLLPPSPRDWLAEDHLTYFISEVVDGLDLAAFYRRYEGDGRRNQPFAPRMMVKILIYGYATGRFSSRKIAKALHEDVAFRVLAAGNFPAHRTIAEFRQLHLKEFQELFVQVVRIAQEAGLVKLGTVAIDGSKVKGNASKHKSMSYGRMREEEKRLRKEIRELTEKATCQDAEEDERFGADRTGEELPKELQRREERLAKIRAAMKRVEERQAEADREKGRSPGDEKREGKPGPKFKRPFGVPKDETQDNFTDPDSRIMKSRGKSFEQGYNAQIAVDDSNHLIVASDLTQNAADSHELIPLVEKVKSHTGETPRQVLADAGYKGDENFQYLEGEGVEGYVSLGREGKAPPESKPDRPKLEATERMRKKLAGRGKAIYKKRKGTVEPVFGWIKHVLGFRQFSLRGVEKVRGEWDLVCLALNLRRLNAKMA